MGLLAVTILWITTASIHCFRHRCTKITNLQTFTIYTCLWVGIAVVACVSQLVQSVYTLNDHYVCMPNTNSGNVNIIINALSADKIGDLRLTVVQDPNQVYTHICMNMDQYYSQSKTYDRNVIVWVFGVLWVGFVWVIGLYICGMVLDASNYRRKDSRRRRENEGKDIEMKDTGKEPNINEKK